MRAIEYSALAADPAAHLRLVTKPVPSADGVHAVVKIVTAAINLVDCKIAAHGFWPMTLPFVPGYDAAGVVHELPPSYGGDLRVGDRVFVCNWGVSKHWDSDETSQGGAFAEYARFPVHKMAKIPDTVTFDAAAASALVSLTAYQSLFEILKITPGARILIIGGAGAVGHAAIQLAKGAGCWVATTSSPRNAAMLTALGVDKVIDYTAAHWYEDAALRGIDAIFDAIGEAGFFGHAHAHGVVRDGGSMVSIVGQIKGHEEHASQYGSLSNFILHHSAEQLSVIARMLADGSLRVPIDESFEFSQQGAVDMYRKQAAGKSTGKNVFRIG